MATDVILGEKPPNDPAAAVISRLVIPHPPAFALLHRPESRTSTVEILVGDAFAFDRLADLPLPGDSATSPDELVVLLPYRQILERGYVCHDDRTPAVAIGVRTRVEVPRDDLLRLLPDEPVELSDGVFDVDDKQYARMVRTVLTDEIGRGEGSNFVLKRSFLATVRHFSISTALSMFRRLLSRELGAYWTFIVHTGDRILIGASPELHVGMRDGQIRMNPISGTYRYPDQGPTLPGVLRFLADRKEADELYMVVDEELKMMARICDYGGRVSGPRFTQMARLAHTAYDIAGQSRRDVRDVLRETMFAPTVTGSPVENAYRVIARYERRSRGYYSGVLAHIGRDPAGRHTLDSAILIRTADVDRYGRLDIGVGATLVRHSDPDGEVAETHSKVAGLLRAFTELETDATGMKDRVADLSDDPAVRRALAQRNATLARFWLDGGELPIDSTLPGHRVLVIDAEDTFTDMLAHQLRALRLVVDVRGYRDLRAADLDAEPHDLLVVGPGPGDPTSNDPRIRRLLEIVENCVARRAPFLAVCLGHQVLSRYLGLPIARRATPNQGVQREVDLFGRSHRVGFYNTFVAQAQADELVLAAVPGVVRVSRDVDTGDVHALAGEFFRSMQFHPESILTEQGVTILADHLRQLLAKQTVAR